jgi:DNA-binding winged helix-turn-helix (wHTH) protein
MKDQPLVSTFRQREVIQILGAIQAGESCTIVGIGSAGKSNLLRFLQRPDVLQDHLGAEWDQYLLVYVDGNKLLKLSLWGLIELMLHQTTLALGERGAVPGRDDAHEIAAALDELYDKAIQAKPRAFSVRYLDRALHLVRKHLGLRLVYLLDEFDALYERLPARGFSALRALRDDHKYRLTYLVAIRQEWARLRTDRTAVEAFEELVSPHTIWLGPHTEPDARDMLDRLSARYGSGLNESTQRTILKETGGHSGLLRAAYRTAVERPHELSRALRSSTRIQDESRRIWFSLPAEEQKVVAALAADPDNDPPIGPVLTRLRNKGLVTEVAPLKYALFSRLFGDCILNLELQAGNQIEVDRGRRIVQVGDRRIEHLSRLTFRLIDYLEQHRGQSCSRAELTHYLYPDELEVDGTGSADGRLDTIVTRLRKAVEPDPRRPRYVITDRGHGYRLADGEEQG